MNVYFAKDRVFVIPKSGTYQVTTKTYYTQPTGRKISIKNPDRKWYTFWKPEFIVVDEVEVIPKGAENTENSKKRQSVKLLNWEDISGS
jgi:hypothetical protein